MNRPMSTIQSVCVIGSGVMGTGIAAHLANCGLQVLLLDIVPDKLTDAEMRSGLTLSSPAVRNRYALAAIQRMKLAKPSPLYDQSFASRIKPGNMEDDLPLLGQADWIIEAVSEKLEIKKQVYRMIERHYQKGTIVSSNTSGISLREMTAHVSETLQEHFLGTHFFNPPRYMKLLEIIPGPLTRPEIVQEMVSFAERKLGKGVVIAKDTPNFIANRIGTYGLLVTMKEMLRAGLSVEEVDAVTGPAMGRPKSATFRTLDLVGLDTFVHVANNVEARAHTDEERAIFQVPPVLTELVKRGWTGEKSGSGFYRKVKDEHGSSILSLNMATLEYAPVRKPSSASLEAAKQAKGAAQKINALLAANDKYATFAWNVLKHTLIYAASKVGEIADSITDIDRAMKWGFHWALGPFEIWDAIGLAKSVERMEREATTVPAWVKEWLADGNTSFYHSTGGTRSFVSAGVWRKEETLPEHLSLSKFRAQGAVIRSNEGASLLEIGDGVLCVELHSPKSAIAGDILTMLNQAVEEAEARYDALIIASEQSNFCVGANLMLLLMEAQDEEWDEIESIIRLFQDTMMRLKYCAKPVVAAPYHMTLGGGVELCLAADHVCASAETYYGLVEAGVGLIPAGGGCKELSVRLSKALANKAGVDAQPFVNQLFETIGMAKVSTSAHDARRLGLLRESDTIVMNRDRLLHEAKKAALYLAESGYSPPDKQREQVRAVGKDGKAVLQLSAWLMQQGGHISEHDLLIASKLAHVLAGGDVPAGTVVSEQYMLDLEREAFLSLCGEPKTQQRMQHMLATGKPLRN